MAEYYFTVCIYCIHHIFCVQSSTDGHLDSFHILATVNNAAVNMGVQASPWDPVFIFFESVPRSRIAGSYGGSTFDFWRNLHTLVRSGYTKFPFPPTMYKCSLFSQFLLPFAMSCLFSDIFGLFLKWVIHFGYFTSLFLISVLCGRLNFSLSECFAKLPERFQDFVWVYSLIIFFSADGFQDLGI